MNLFNAVKKFFRSEVKDGGKEKSPSELGGLLGSADSQRNPADHGQCNPVENGDSDELWLKAQEERLAKLLEDEAKVPLQEALRQMGYVRRLGKMWTKPVGFGCFAFNEEVKIWYCYFRAYSGGKLLCYSWAEFAGEQSALRFLKEQEAWQSRTNIGDAYSQLQHESWYL